MRTNLRKTAELGEVVAVAFDRAARYSTNPRKVARLVTQTVAIMLGSQPGRATSSRWPSFVIGDRSS